MHGDSRPNTSNFVYSPTLPTVIILPTASSSILVEKLCVCPIPIYSITLIGVNGDVFKKLLDGNRLDVMNEEFSTATMLPRQAGNEYDW